MTETNGVDMSVYAQATAEGMPEARPVKTVPTFDSLSQERATADGMVAEHTVIPAPTRNLILEIKRREDAKSNAVLEPGKEFHLR